GVDFVLEKRNVRPDGAYVWVRKHVSLVRDAAGRPQYAAVVSEDITERKRAEAEIADLNARLQRAVAESHHRIKNNLQILSAMVDMQRNNAQESVPKSELERLGIHILTLASLHDMLTSESKVSTESLDIVSLKTALEKLVPMLQTAAGGRRIVIRMEEEIVLPLKQGGSFILLVNELVSNAIKHGKGDVEVHLRSEPVWPPQMERRKRPRARLEVCDDGPGFPPDFDPRNAANTGLELIESFGRWDLKGRVVFENRVEGGARVVVTFPLFASAEAVVQAVSASPC
ncbi:MAG TPA: histidine kinase dimerization/phosphoacceptor domain -containing protein, partial [Chthonomonadaceae bacterium]|nr:histidine kinase dimerization/phosphoacceptor domain -containing protein [Chthonomonadaceae bacterium]